MLRYLNAEICKECQGECCKSLPGACLPNDFTEPILISLVKAFESGKYAVDWWERDPRPDKDEISRGYFIRPAIKGAKNLFDPSWGNKICIFLTDEGCELNYDERPAGCRALEPKEDFRCISHGADKQEASIAWIPYHEDILLAAKIIRNEE